MKYLVLFGIVVVSAGCSTVNEPSTKLTKAQFMAEAKADGVEADDVCIRLYGYECDLCEQEGWYGDGVCDSFCTLPDFDCQWWEADAGPSYEPCGGLSCGDPCTLCNPLDNSCAETQVAKYCDADGVCGINYPDCSVEDDVYSPCQGLSCGEVCTLCAPNDPNCVETAVVKYCDPDGVCGINYPDCSVEDDVYSPCQGLSCGEVCTLCAPNDPNCVETAVEKYCDPDGVCGINYPDCGGAYDPCAGKTCGEQCLLCPPGDPTCVETASYKMCNAQGACSDAAPQCT